MFRIIAAIAILGSTQAAKLSRDIVTISAANSDQSLNSFRSSTEDDQIQREIAQAKVDSAKFQAHQ